MAPLLATTPYQLLISCAMVGSSLLNYCDAIFWYVRRPYAQPAPHQKLSGAKVRGQSRWGPGKEPCATKCCSSWSFSSHRWRPASISRIPLMPYSTPSTIKRSAGERSRENAVLRRRCVAEDMLPGGVLDEAWGGAPQLGRRVDDDGYGAPALSPQYARAGS